MRWSCWGRFQAQWQSCGNEEHFVTDCRDRLVEPALLVPEDPRRVIVGNDTGSNLVGHHDDFAVARLQSAEELVTLAVPTRVIGAFGSRWPQTVGNPQGETIDQNETGGPNRGPGLCGGRHDCFLS